MMFKAMLFIGLLFSICYISIKAEVVCSEEELTREIREDLEDNGRFIL